MLCIVLLSLNHLCNYTTRVDVHPGCTVSMQEQTIWVNLVAACVALEKEGCMRCRTTGPASDYGPHQHCHPSFGGLVTWCFLVYICCELHITTLYTHGFCGLASSGHLAPLLLLCQQQITRGVMCCVAALLDRSSELCPRPFVKVG